MGDGETLNDRADETQRETAYFSGMIKGISEFVDCDIESLNFYNDNLGKENE